jgi:ketosteroid isomerase-like protein
MRAILLIVSVLLAVGCGQQREVDVEAERQSVMDADRQFAAETLARGGDGWADFFAEDAIMFPASGKVVGQDSIRAMMARVMTPEAPKLLWEPETATVAASGDLAYTIGRWKSVADPEGEATVLAEGYYLTVWQKTADGGWKVATDMGNVDQPAPPPTPPPGG